MVFFVKQGIGEGHRQEIRGKKKLSSEEGEMKQRWADKGGERRGTGGAIFERKRNIFNIYRFRKGKGKRAGGWVKKQDERECAGRVLSRSAKRKSPLNHAQGSTLFHLKGSAERKVRKRRMPGVSERGRKETIIRMREGSLEGERRKKTQCNEEKERKG